jgi:hypothetical protein
MSPGDPTVRPVLFRRGWSRNPMREMVTPPAFSPQPSNKHREQASDFARLSRRVHIVVGLDEFQYSSRQMMIFLLAGRARSTRPTLTVNRGAQGR